MNIYTGPVGASVGVSYPSQSPKTHPNLFINSFLLNYYCGATWISPLAPPVPVEEYVATAIHQPDVKILEQLDLGGFLGNFPTFPDYSFWTDNYYLTNFLF